MILVAFAAFQRRFEEIEKMLASVGEAETRDSGADRASRSVSFTVNAPGYGLPREATFEYRERYRRTDEGWLREAYEYEYRPQPPPSRRAHHDHRPYGVHQHCHEASFSRPRSHYLDRARLLEEVHEAFEHLYAEGGPVQCAGLHPLRPRPRIRRERTERDRSR